MSDFFQFSCQEQKNMVYFEKNFVETTIFSKNRFTIHYRKGAKCHVRIHCRCHERRR